MTDVVMMDKFGRILIPKAVREQLRLKPDQPLELRSHDGELTLRPTNPGEVIEKDGMYIWTGDVPQDSWEEITNGLREERVDAILGER
jgi:AbrB family looped-hinge helix DNA binding protein